MRAIVGHRAAFVLVLVLVLGGSSCLTGQTTWTGALSSNWGTAGNWTAGSPTSSVNATIAAGTPNAPSTSGVASAACSALTVNAGAILTIPPGSPLAVSGSVAVNGSIAGGGLLSMVGSANCDLGASTIGASLQIAKAGTAQVQVVGSVSVTGNLTQTSGEFMVGAGGGFTVSVSGNAQFQGGALTHSFVGVLDVAGDVTFSGTTMTGSTTIRCGGNWVSNAAFAATTNLVVFDGAGLQTLTTAGTFGALTIEPTSNVTTSSSLTVNGALTIQGSLSMTAGTLDVNGAFVLPATASLTLPNGTHSFGSNFTVNGALTASGTLVFDGGGSAALSTTAALPNVQMSKNAGAQVTLNGDVTVNGNLTQTSGDFMVSAGGTFTMAVSGNAQFQGGTLSHSFAGIIDVAGNVTFSGTTMTGNPTIRCGGAWVSNAAYAPAGGLVIFDGTGAQSVTSAGTFGGVTIEATSSITTGTSLTLNGPLTVNGSLSDTAATLTVNGALAVNGSMSLAPGSLDLNGNLSVGASGALALGAATHTVAGGLTVTGGLTASGTLVFDGSFQAVVSSTAALPNVQISKSGAGQVTLNGNVPVNGNLTQTSGELMVSIGGTFTMAVSGSAQFQGGTLSHSFIGIIDVAGNVTFSGTTMTGNPTIRCGGNWISNAAFVTAGAVELDGSSATTIAHAVPGGTLSVSTLVISNGTRTMVNDFTLASSSVTIAPGGSLAISAGRHLRVHRPTGATAFNVNGALSVAGNGELSMGPQTSAAVGASGSLSLVGAPAQTAKVTGEAGGGYALAIDGALAAKDFVVKEMGPAGMVVGLGATIAAAPNDVRNGTLDFRAGATAGSVLLDLRRQAPAANFDALAFLNTPGAAGVFNVKTAAAGVPISFTNWTGAFAGPAFESDPNNLIAWNLQPGPTVASFVVVPGAELAQIVWHTTSSVNVTSYQLRKATAATGPFSVFHTTPNTGSNYGIVDSPLAANQTVFYAGYAVMSGGDVLLIGTGSATPYSSAPPGNVKKVGGNGAFATIQAAINAATDPNSVVWVTPGTYDSFTIGATATPSNLRILGDDTTGPVIISTVNGPIVIQNVPASSGVELSNLTVGSATTAQNGIVISNCGSPVVLDEVQVSCAATHTAISVSAAPATAIQRCNIQGGTGLSVGSASYVAISRGSLSSLVSTASTIEISALTPGSVNVTPPSSLIPRAGVMPDVNLPEFIKLATPSALFLSAQPNAPFVIAASRRLGFQTGGAVFEMPLLLDPVSLVELPLMFTDGLGQALAGFTVSPSASLLGFAFTVQVVVADPVTGTPRLSNVESMVCIP